jgi:hypothetical protein
MATVIDAFVVELGLDPKKFTQGQKDAVVAFRKTQQEALDAAKKIQSAGEVAAEFFSVLQRRALGLIGIMLGGRGISQFAGYITENNAALARLSRNFGVAVPEVSKWQKAVELAGGTADGVAQSIQTYSDALQAYQAGLGDVNFVAMLDRLASEGGKAIDKTKPITTQFLTIAENLSKVAEKSGIVRANWFGRLLGLDPGTINLMVQGIDKTRSFIAEAERLGVVSQKQADEAEPLLKAWNAMIQAGTNLGNVITNILTPALVGLLDTWTKAFTQFSRGVFVNPDSWLGRILGKFKGGEGSTESLRRRFGAPEDVPVVGPLLKSLGESSVKPGAGTASPSIQKLAEDIQTQVPGIKQFTAFNDVYHAFLGAGAHPQGRALDFTLNDPRQSEAIARDLRVKLRAMGVDATVIDEYKTPSRGSTGGHLHVQFNSPEAARRFQESGGGGAGGSPAGLPSQAGAPAAAAAGNVDNRQSSARSEVNIAQLTVQTQAADAERIARDIKPAIERTRFALLSNSGPA